ncbi:hypothetical protein FGG08_006146 [Glutinoglossum americanum]|uniref:Uncharacterized protein n=1 Tax=Glutinoglossum americanum TaxID=1670608 RepID=A0A9P8I239_9PEZI|nr:hypothetical protein FGG08_006146 [Glutinoglossum americanum]
MKRVVEVERYVDDVVDVWIPKPRITRSDSSITVLSAAHPATRPTTGHRNIAFAAPSSASRMVPSAARFSLVHFADRTRRKATMKTSRRKRNRKKKLLVENVARGEAVETVNSVVVGDGRRIRRCGGWVSMAPVMELDALARERCGRLGDLRGLR